MKTDNELIAEFMGFTCADTGQDRFWNPPGMPFATIYDWKYHSNHLDDFKTSWDWLMPVVQAIEELEETHPSNDPTKGTVWPYQFDILSRNKVEIYDHVFDRSIVMINEDGITKIQSVYKAVVEFIRWHNTQNQTN